MDVSLFLYMASYKKHVGKHFKHICLTDSVET